MKIAGLQSYRQAQEIDFTALTEMGLFGIFGPTGSGKSTILDAITLAMYGKVGRASGGTQGIMNQSEDALFVSFTFELTSAVGNEKYRVERRFKRMNEVSISNTISRFIALTEKGEVVLADKLADVTKCVEQKIGLKFDDFTRAVVLPQGKFAEFLSLKGVDRRAMLQRLFHLEQYGDVLGQKVNRHLKEHEQKLRELQAEQQGLGTASIEHVEAVDSVWQIAVMYAKEKQESHEQVQQQLQQLSIKRQWSRELDAATSQMNRLQTRDAGIQQMQYKLMRASAAASLKSPLHLLKKLKQQMTEHERQLAIAVANLELANKKLEEATDQMGSSKQQLLEKEPVLLQRIDQLEQALLLEKECSALHDQIRELQEKIEAGKQKQQLITQQLDKEEQLLIKAQQRKDELEQLAKQNEVKPTKRKEAQEALWKEQEAIRLRQQRIQLEAEEAQWIDKNIQVKQQAVELQKKQNQLIHQRQHILLQVQQAMLQQTNLKKEVSIDMATLQRIHHKLQQLGEHEQKVRWASQLAQDLAQGEPCLVCGSVHHPVPAESSKLEASHEELQLSLNKIQAWTSDYSRLEYSYTRDIEQCTSLIESLEELQPIEMNSSQEESIDTSDNSLQEQEIAATSTVNQLHKDQAYDESLQDEDSFSYWFTRLQTCGHKLKEMQEKYEEDQTVIKQFVQQVKGLQLTWRELASAWVTIMSEETSIKKSMQDVTERKALLEKELSKYESILTQLHVQDSEVKQGPAALLWEQIEQKDVQAEDIKERLTRSLPFIEGTTANIQQFKQQLIEFDKEQLQYVTQLQGKSELLEEKQARLHHWSHGQEVVPLLTSIKQELEGLRQQVRATELEHEQALRAFHEQSTGHGIAGQALTSVKEQYHNQIEVWEQALSASPFQHEDEVAEAWMDEEQMKQQSAQVESYLEERHRLEVTMKDLQSKLGDERVDEALWEDRQKQVEQTKSEAELALRNVAKLERDLEDIKHRHTRWQELEHQGSKLAHKLSLLVKLQTSLRGNAFVEYIAEEQLMNVSRSASQRLKYLTNQRYALESDSGGGFVIRDDANGGMKRPVATLSGGETFLTSLALALALSAQIQLRGQYPLQFFFLDEGFGTLDPELLDTVITSLEHLHHEHLAVGVISHVAELRARLPRKLVVIPAESGGDGSKIVLEKL